MIGRIGFRGTGAAFALFAAGLALSCGGGGGYSGRRLSLLGNWHAPLPNCGSESRMVALGLLKIGERESGNGVGKGVAGTTIARDHRRVAGLRMGKRQRPAAQAAICGEAIECLRITFGEADPALHVGGRASKHSVHHDRRSRGPRAQLLREPGQ